MEKLNGVHKLIADMKKDEVYNVPEDWKTRGWQTECETTFRKKNRLADGSYFTFLVSAGVGSGKTALSALIAGYLLNRKSIDRIVFVCPNRAIRNEVIEVFRRFNIHLVRWKRSLHSDGEPNSANGVVLTYQALIRDVDVLGRLCDLSTTLVIFDEIHHLGDDLSWGEKAEVAFKFRAKCVLGLSGTPFRSDNREVKFVEYETAVDDGLKVFKPDFTYTLGRAILDGVCARPVFHWLHADVRIMLPGNAGKTIATMEEELPLNLQNRRLNGAILPGSVSRSLALKDVVEFSRRKRFKLIIFVGGDTNRKDGGGVRDATELLPCELRSLGIKPREVCSVTADDKDAHAKIKAFGQSDAWILVAVNMVSEGVDIPELSVALFLTSITSRLTTIQRIGRVLRCKGEAHIFMFADGRLIEIAKTIETQINHEIELGHLPPQTTPTTVGGGLKADGEAMAIGLTCEERDITINGITYPFDDAVKRKYSDIMATRGYPEGQPFFSILIPMIHEALWADRQRETSGRRPAVNPDPGYTIERAAENPAILTDNFRLVESLRATLSGGQHSFDSTPLLVEEILAAHAWRDRMGRDGQRYTFDEGQFAEFITCEPPRGLGTPLDEVRKYLGGSGNPLRVAFEAELAKEQGNPIGRVDPVRLDNGRYSSIPNDGRDTGDDVSPPESRPVRDRSNEPQAGNSIGYAVRRLGRERPDLLERVQSGELSANAAAIEAGFRARTVAIPLESQAATRLIVRHFPGHELEALIRGLANWAGFSLIASAETDDHEEPIALARAEGWRS